MYIRCGNLTFALDAMLKGFHRRERLTPVVPAIDLVVAQLVVAKVWGARSHLPHFTCSSRFEAVRVLLWSRSYGSSGGIKQRGGVEETILHDKLASTRYRTHL